MDKEVFRNHVMMVASEVRTSRNFFRTYLDLVRPLDPELGRKIDKVLSDHEEILGHIHSRLESR